MSSFSNLDRRRFLTMAAAGAVSLGQSTTRAQQDAGLPNVV
ncbi:MAG: twin-arginine translocation signal domain-containing protein, partial [Nitrospirae bacterium]|nr:twin-arginine translocation signal domain-containing protein [Nitrospirota bacterium]